MRRLLLIVLCLLAVVSIADAQKRTSKDVEKEQRQNQRKIEQTEEQIKQNKSDVSRQLDRLQSLNAVIELRADTIARLQRQVNKMNDEIIRMDDSISFMTENLNTLRQGYGDMLREIRSRRQAVSDFAFIFSAKSFSQAWSRMRYLQQMARTTKQRAAKIQSTADELSLLRDRQKQARAEVQASLKKIKRSQNSLISERSDADRLVDRLKKSEKALNKELKRRQDLANQLERELNEIIEAEIAEQKRREEEARREAERLRAEQEKSAKNPAKQEPAKPAPEQKPKNELATKTETTRKLSGSFESNKGNLLFPVVGEYTIIEKFGRSEYKSEVKSLAKTENHGITIEVPAGTEARAVFDGTVIAIFNLAEYRNIVMVSHGKYTTVYTGIESLLVRKGDNVKAGASLGTLYTDDYDNRTILNFQVRRETEKLDPLDWVK